MNGFTPTNTPSGINAFQTGRQGIMPAYNAQAMVSPLDQTQASGSGMLITAAEVVSTAADSAQLVPMLEKSEESTGARVPITLADGGYHTAANLEAGARRGDVFLMPERYHPGVQGPYFKDRFVYDATAQLSVPSRPLSRAKQEQRQDTRTLSCLPSLQNCVPRLSSLRCLHERRALGTCSVDRAQRYPTP